MSNKLIIPIYLECDFKTNKQQKKNKNGVYKTSLNINQIKPMNRFIYSKIKNLFFNTMKDKVKKLKIYKGKEIFVVYNLYYKYASSDLPNVTSVISKFILDTLTKCGIITDDNVNIVKGEATFAIEKDIANPRIEMFLYLYEDIKTNPNLIFK